VKGTIKSKERIAWLFDHGNRKYGPGYMVIYHAFDDSLDPDVTGRLAFIAGKKMGSAPVRNRAKRRLREAARSAGAPWRGLETVFVARKEILQVDFETLTQSIKQLGSTLTDQQVSDQGKGVDGTPAPRGEKLRAFVVGIPRNFAIVCINVYRHAISPLLPPSCRYVPSCSEYALIAFERFGFWRGLWLSVKRIGRCHPFVKGGYDPVPEKVSIR